MGTITPCFVLQLLYNSQSAINTDWTVSELTMDTVDIHKNKAIYMNFNLSSNINLRKGTVLKHVYHAVN